MNRCVHDRDLERSKSRLRYDNAQWEKWRIAIQAHSTYKNNENKQLVNVHGRSQHELFVCVCVSMNARSIRGFLVMNFCFDIRCCGFFYSLSLSRWNSIHFSRKTCSRGNLVFAFIFLILAMDKNNTQTHIQIQSCLFFNSNQKKTDSHSPENKHTTRTTKTTNRRKEKTFQIAIIVIILNMYE